MANETACPLRPLLWSSGTCRAIEDGWQLPLSGRKPRAAQARLVVTNKKQYVRLRLRLYNASVIRSASTADRSNNLMWQSFWQFQCSCPIPHRPRIVCLVLSALQSVDNWEIEQTQINNSVQWSIS
ncbi:unnamed protein product [Periconia digitata]|uniref:Uncharacterized protein n=1 Tax=Periconia digitata TaxID=1303443 RepID=A0A9W4U8T9_9PLEO|nr:unnamed protein product [Periconia digitata]